MLCVLLWQLQRDADSFGALNPQPQTGLKLTLGFCHVILLKQEVKE